jgi:ligand-binding sensor domain-containing protein
MVMTQSSVLTQRAALNQLFRNRNLTCMFADSRGFVWFCTSRGLVRFDGRSEVTFGERDGLAATPPNIVFEDSGGGFWVGGPSDLFQLNPTASGNRRQAFSRVVRPGGGAIGPVYGFSNSRDGAIWAASGTGLWRVARREGKTAVSEVDIAPSDSANDRVIRAVLEDPQRTLWAGSSHGLYRRASDGIVTRLGMRDGLPSDQITALAWADGYLWAGTGNGVARLKTDAPAGPDSIRTFTADDGLPAAAVTALSVDRNEVGVSTSGGTARILAPASNGPRVFTSSFGRPVTDALARTSDAAGNSWSATAAGAFRILGRRFSPIAQFRGQGLLSLLRVDQGVCGLPSQPRSPAVCERPVSLLSIEPPAADKPSGLYPYYVVNAPSTGWSPLTATDSRGRWFIPTPQGIAQFASRAAVEQSVVAKMWTASDGLPAGDVTALYGDSEGGLWVAMATSDESHIVRIDADTGRARVWSA